MALPTGLVALLFADIEKSTEGLQRFGDAQRDAIRCLHDAAALAAEKHGGQYVDYRGDGFYLAFPLPLAAVRCAGELQSLLLGPEWGAIHPPLRLRIGIHTGLVGIYNGQYDGLTVWQTHRLMEAAHGTQTLLSDATHSLVHDDLSHYPDLKCRPLGPFRLRDIEESMSLFRVAVVGLPGQSEEAPRVPAIGRHNFVDEERPFIGREKERAAIVEYFRQRGARLVTITGIGGMGKTRLAKQAAWEMADDFPGGVYLAEMDNLRHRDEILPALCNALNLEASLATNETQLYAALESRRMLLVLDCFELLKEHADVIENLLKATKEPRCLITSRRALGLPREFTYSLEPMSLGEMTLNEMSQSEKFPGFPPQGAHPANNHADSLGDSLTLFAEAASHVLPEFALTPQNQETVQEICELLEGIPLSIVFAAGWLRYLSLDELREQTKTRRLDILTPETERAADSRHADVRRVIEDSFVMLPPDGRRLLHQLALFSGGFSLEDSQRICDEPSPMAMVKKIARLGEHSFVQKKAQGERTRYRLLDTVREYLETVEKDAALGEELTLGRQRHAAHYAAVARQIQERMQQGHWTEAGATLWGEIGNFRAAVSAAMALEQKALVLELADGLLRTYFEAGLWTDFTTLMSAAEAAAVSLDRPDRLTPLLGLQGAFAKRRGETETAQRLWERRLTLCQQIGDVTASVDALLDLAQLAQEAGHLDAAQRLIRQATRLAQELQRPALLAKALTLRAEIALAMNDLSGAAKFAEQAKSRLGDAPDLDKHLKIRVTLGRVYSKGGDNERAVTAYKEMLRAAVDGNRVFDISLALLEIGAIYERQKATMNAAKAYLAAERCLTHNPSPRHENAKRELIRLTSQTDAPEIHAFLQEARHTLWQDLVAEVLDSSAFSQDSPQKRSVFATGKDRKDEISLNTRVRS